MPGIPQHITHRGVNRGATYIDGEDFAAYLQALEHVSGEQGVSIHGYVLMTNHVHLLVSAEVAGAVSRMMQALKQKKVKKGVRDNFRCSHAQGADRLTP